MKENPYSALLNTIRNDTRSMQSRLWCMGEVVTVEPLIIKTGEHHLSGLDLWVNTQLVQNVEPATLQDVTGALHGSTNCTVGDMSALQVTGGTLHAAGIFGGVLHPKDQVVLLPSGDGQEYVVLCKVVKPLA